MKPKFSKTILNHKFIFGIIMVILISSMVFPSTVFGITVAGKVTTVTGKVTIVQPTFCGKKINQFDHVITGTQKNDVLIGKHGNDLIQGLGGNDIIIGKTGNDCLLGGDGNDIIIGGSGGDAMYGDNGDDVIIGGDGNDKIDGGNGFDICVGGKGQNIILNCESTSGKQKNFMISQAIHDLIYPDPNKKKESNEGQLEIPKWMKNDVTWWQSGKISDDDFGNAIQYMVSSWNK